MQKRTFPKLLPTAGLERGAELAVVPAYIATIAFAEWLGAEGNLLVSLVYSMILLVILLAQYVMMRPASYRQLLPALALVPLMRILSLVMPVRFVPAIYWYVLINLPLLLAIFLAAQLLRATPRELGLRMRAWPTQLAIAVVGVPLGLAAFLILRPAPLVRLSTLDAPHLVSGAAILLVFVGFTEELLFRGLLQREAEVVFGRLGLAFSSLLFAIMYIGSQSVGYVLFMGLVGLFYGWCVRRTGSIWGAALSHGLLAIGLVLIWPLAQRQLGAESFDQITAFFQLAAWMLLAIGLGLGALALFHLARRAAAGRARPS
jgi:membrane protease YdiL (CAAX protease family)